MSSEIQSDANENESWEPCPSGQLSRLNQQIKSRNHREISNRRILVTGLFLIALAPAILWNINRNINNKNNLGGISCKNVQTHFVAYSQNDLDEKVLKQINTHLEGCKMCQKLYREKTNKQSGKTARVFFLKKAPFPKRDSFRVLAFHQPEQE